MSTCPQCRKELVREHGERGLAWRCPDCGGREVTMAVLRKTFAVEAVNGLWQKARGLGSGSGRRCPECGLNMREVPATDSPAATRLEVCPTCTLIWFDAEEYEALPARPPKPTPEEPELPEEAREALAMAKMQAIQDRADAEATLRNRLTWWQLIGFPPWR